MGKILARIFVSLSLLTLLVSLGANFSVVQAAKQESISQTIDATTKELKKEFGLVLPDYVEDPNYKVVFKNPSKEPVEVSVDGKVYKDVKSPFKLPNLTIGKHTLVFKYTNKDGVLRVLTLSIIVVPRPPLLADNQKKVFQEPEEVLIHGTALPGAKILALVDSAQYELLEVDSTGNWHVTFEKLKPGEHKVMFFTIKNGIINTTPLIFTFEYKSPVEQITVTPTTTPSGMFTVIDMAEEKINYVLTNKDLLTYLIGGVSAVLIALLALFIKNYLKQREQEKTLAELLNLDDKTIIDVLDGGEKKTSGRKSKSSASKKSRKKQNKTTQPKPEDLDAQEEEGNKLKHKTKSRTDRKSSSLKKKQSEMGTKKSRSSKKNSKKGTEDEVIVEPERELSDIKVKKIKVSLLDKGTKVMSKEEFLKKFRISDTEK